MADDVLAPDERAWLTQQTRAGAAFTRLWTRKEAAVKCSGVGIGCDLTSFSTLHRGSRIPTPAGAMVDVTIVDIAGEPSMAVALACPTETPLRIWHVDGAGLFTAEPRRITDGGRLETDQPERRMPVPQRAQLLPNLQQLCSLEMDPRFTGRRLSSSN